MATLTSVSKYFPVASETYSDNLSSTISAGATTVSVNNASAYSDGDIVVLTVDYGTANQATFTGTKSGNTFINCVWTEGNTGVGHSTGATIQDIDSATHFGIVTKGIRTQHNQDGSHGAVTATGLTLAGNFSQSSGTFTLQDSVLNSRALVVPYKAAAYKSSTTAISANTWTKVSLDTEFYDTGSNFDNVTNYRFTAPVAGYYQVNAQVGVGSSGISTTAAGVASLYKNGTAFIYGPAQLGSGNGVSPPRSGFSTLIKLAANDYLEMWAFCTEARDIVGLSTVTYMTVNFVSIT